MDDDVWIDMPIPLQPVAPTRHLLFPNDTVMRSTSGFLADFGGTNSNV